MPGSRGEPQFVYRSSIGSDEIRLLRPQRQTRDLLSFTVLQVPRTAAPSYTAVSYTWGDEAPSEVISLDGKAFPVRLNLWSLLYYLSDAARHERWNYLWVDAICINQQDNMERSAQVSRMDQTYKGAVCVSAWLGLAPVPECYSSDLPASTPIKTLEVGPLDWDLSMADLANRPYWTRFWVIQEFLLGQNVELYCSNTRMNWQDFKDMLCRVVDVDPYLEEAEADDSQINKYAALPLVMARHIDKHPEILQPLQNLLVEHRHSKCKEPRDRVFALLGLVTEEEQRLLRRILPNYEIPEDHVLVYALAHLVHYGPLAITLRQDYEEVTADSDKVFQGLGISSDKQRRKCLLRRAKRFDYLADLSGQELLWMLADGDEYDSLVAGGSEQGLVGDYGSINWIMRQDPLEENTTQPRKWQKRALRLAGFLIVLAVIWNKRHWLV